MEEPVDFHDWELLQTPEGAENLKPFTELEAEPDDGGAIKSDYFALDSDARYPKRAALGGGASEEEGLADSDNPSWVEPESDSRYLDHPKEELGLSGIGFPRSDFGGFWSDESSDGQRSQIDSEKGELARAEDSKFGLGFEGIADGHQISDGGEATKETIFGGIREIGGGEMENENPGEVGSDASAEMGEKRMSSKNVSVGGEEKMGMVWWKLPLEFLKLCVFRVKPVWSISIAAAILGLVILGRRLHKMKHKSRSISLKISIDDKVRLLADILA
ncbi:ATG8-interacting protein 2 [Cocos nucifera]|uniref:ATG8-interacting protein 2 n=1 Tax=Cocos nucifera TaxID=13894 RepID=A0A8K0IND1_COCNU|nr:ATG8-interacting protein 2 [Cocos nucifera]